MSNDPHAPERTDIRAVSSLPMTGGAPDLPARFCIGVDGGGSGTRVLIALCAPTSEPGEGALGSTAPPLGDGQSAQAGAGWERPLSATIAWPLRGVAGPSGLGLGITPAWESIAQACTQAFAEAGIAWQWSDCTMACGLAGVNHTPWRDAFIAAAPPLRSLSVFSDAFTTWAGALGGGMSADAGVQTASPAAPVRSMSPKASEAEARPRMPGRRTWSDVACKGDRSELIAGVVIALGTGSIGCAMDAERGWRTVGGFGFPSGDEASGAWFGLQAAGYAQRALDGRAPIDAFARALIDAMAVPEPVSPGGAPRHREANGIAPATMSTTAAALPSGRDRLQAWLASAKQTDYASLMRVVVRFQDHPVVRDLRVRAGADVDAMIDALDPERVLPVVLAGSVAPWLASALAGRHQVRLRPAAGDAAAGALRVAQGWIRQV